MSRLFGTDGVRGHAGRYPLDPPTVRRIGAALVRALRQGDAPVRLLVGRDTRESGDWIERELAFGASGEGASVVSAGVVPTPAIAYVTPASGYTAGVVISASHNPFEDNGIKVFSGTGEKLSEAREQAIEAMVADATWAAPVGEAGPVAAVDCRAAYLAHLRRIVPPDESLRRLSIVVDCANGATTTVAPELFRELGLDVHCIGCSPDGRNINLRCGSTAPALLAQTVVDGGYHLGIAFDGDGDRAIFVDGLGRVVDGDAVMFLCAKQMLAERRLKGGAIVATVMSNIGLELALRDVGLSLVRCAVGDKYVSEEMVRRGLSLGGEQSGHIIFAEHLLTGDGLATALNVLRTLVATGRTLADLASEMTAYPQVLLNVRVPERVPLEHMPAVVEAMARVEARLGGQGRLLVRYSGTEPLLRVMLEGQDATQIRGWAEEIIAAASSHFAVVP